MAELCPLRLTTEAKVCPGVLKGDEGDSGVGQTMKKVTDNSQ